MRLGYHPVATIPEKQGILIKVFCLCKSNQQATWLTYSEEGLYVDEGLIMRCNLRLGKKLTSGQTTFAINFNEIRCRKKSDEECEVPPHHTWVDRIINEPYFYLVRGKDEGRPAWPLCSSGQG